MSQLNEPGQEEEAEELYFAHSASLRIFGEEIDFEMITRRLGLEPTHCHRRGERRSPRSDPWPHDMWRYRADLPEERDLYEHIDLLWSQIQHSKEFLLSLKEHATVDVFLGYRSNCDTAGVDVPASSLELFVELDVPFALSVIIV